MAEPKKKLSKTRTNRRRAQYKIELAAFVNCKNCDRAIRPHRICPHCHFYNGVSTLKAKASKSKIIVSDDPAAK